MFESFLQNYNAPPLSNYTSLGQPCRTPFDAGLRYSIHHNRQKWFVGKLNYNLYLRTTGVKTYNHFNLQLLFLQLIHDYAGFNFNAGTNSTARPKP
jgi:hypothetical protein